MHPNAREIPGLKIQTLQSVEIEAILLDVVEDVIREMIIEVVSMIVSDVQMEDDMTAATEENTTEEEDTRIAEMMIVTSVIIEDGGSVLVLAAEIVMVVVEAMADINVMTEEHQGMTAVLTELPPIVGPGQDLVKEGTIVIEDMLETEAATILEVVIQLEE